jgi:hypothetical protein
MPASTAASASALSWARSPAAATMSASLARSAAHAPAAIVSLGCRRSDKDTVDTSGHGATADSTPGDAASASRDQPNVL